MPLPFDVYVAGASAEIDRAERVIKKLSECSKIRITHDWTRVIRRYREPPDETLLPQLRADLLDGVLPAQRVLVLAPPAGVPSIRIFVEVGCAYSAPNVLDIYTAGDLAPHPWLRALATPTRTFPDDASAVAFLISEAGSQYAGYVAASERQQNDPRQRELTRLACEYLGASTDAGERALAQAVYDWLTEMPTTTTPTVGYLQLMAMAQESLRGGASYRRAVDLASLVLRYQKEAGVVVVYRPATRES